MTIVTILTTSLLLILSILHLHYQSLFTPVLQHLTHTIVSHPRTFHGYAILHSLAEGELHTQALIDGVVFTPFHPVSILIPCIVATAEGILYALTEEVQGIFQQRVGYRCTRIFLLFKTQGGQSGQGHFGQNDFGIVKLAHYNYKYKYLYYSGGGLT